MRLKKILSYILCFSFLWISFPASSHAVDARIKALGTVALYGTVGGALLGVASLAFGASGRAVAKGASLGLYAGLVFGGYIVYTHYQQKKRSQGGEGDYPEDAGSPYEYEGGGGEPAAGAGPEAPQAWDMQILHQELFLYGGGLKRQAKNAFDQMPLQVQLLKLTF